MTEEQYEAQERARMLRELRAIEKAPLRERQEARAAWTDVLVNNPDIVLERVEWLIGGSYGRGQYDEARRILRANARTNKVAQLMTLTAAFEWRCPPNFSAEVWRKLSPAVQKKLTAAMRKLIARASKELNEE